MTLFILSTKPYDGSDNIYGALRLVKKLVEMKQEVKIFVLVMLLIWCVQLQKPDSYDIDLQAMIKEILTLGVQIKACGTSLKRSGDYKMNHI